MDGSVEGGILLVVVQASQGLVVEETVVPAIMYPWLVLHADNVGAGISGQWEARVGQKSETGA